MSEWSGGEEKILSILFCWKAYKFLFMFRILLAAFFLCWILKFVPLDGIRYTYVDKPHAYTKSAKMRRGKESTAVEIQMVFCVGCKYCCIGKVSRQTEKTWWKHTFERILCDIWNVTVWIAFALLKLALAVVNEI